jgi:hypothetical protein
MLISLIAGLLGGSVGFFAGAIYSARTADFHRDDAERAEALSELLQAENEALKQTLSGPPSAVRARTGAASADDETDEEGERLVG